LYLDDVTMILSQKVDDAPQGTAFIGAEGNIFVNRGKLAAAPPEILKTELTSSGKPATDLRRGDRAHPRYRRPPGQHRRPHPADDPPTRRRNRS
jgi:hypothetical protein